MKVLILAGGLGTRLSEETDIRPKPMVEIGGKPILWHIMKIYSSYGFTVNLLEACRKVEDEKAIIIITSDKCYENRECNKGYDENDALGGHDPYSASKGCAEIVTSS